MVKKSGTAYVSKGERPNVSRKLVNVMRRERRANPTLKMILARMTHRNELAKRQDKSSKEAFQRILDRESIHYQASDLYEKYKTAYTIVKTRNGDSRRSYCTWSACVQAVVTDWVPSFNNKWSPRLGQANDEDKSKETEKR